MDKLGGSVALVTGAGRGVGAATALKLAREGAAVVVNDLDAAEARATVHQIQSEGLTALCCPGSVTEPDFPQVLIQSAIDEFGHLDILVNNAGYIWNGAMHNHSDEQWQAMLDIHMTAPFRILRAWSDWLRPTAKAEIGASGVARCRKVVNISSVSGTRGSATQIAYAAGKAGIVGLTKTLAKEWGRYNVTVNCVAFGHIDTRLTQSYEDNPPSISVGDRQHRVGLSSAQVDASRRNSPLHRIGSPEDGAGAIYLFCIPESDFITGEILTCSGGA